VKYAGFIEVLYPTLNKIMYQLLLPLSMNTCCLGSVYLSERVKTRKSNL